MFCAYFHIPFSTGTGNCCYLSGCLVPELLTFSPGVAALHQVCYLHREFHTVFAVPGYSNLHATGSFSVTVKSEIVSLKCAKTKKKIIWC
jgi:hypothetical protein